MNQILYRGKRKDNHEWIYGYVIQEPNRRTFIGTYQSGGMWDWVEVEAETVGQYVGLADKNGVKVFLGDVVNCLQNCPCEVIFLQEYGRMPMPYLASLGAVYEFTGVEEIIGNRWDNPELMGKE